MITSTILGLLIPFIGTSLGAACVLFMKNELSVKTTKMLSGFAAGVMIAASVWSLLIPALEQSQSLGKMQFIPAVAGFMLGMFFLLILDTITPHMHLDNSVEGPKSNFSRQTMMVLAVTLHNIPEGMAVGVLYASWISGTTTITRAAALSLAIGIAIQNFPESAKTQADQIILDARARAEAEQEKALERTRQEADSMLEKAKADIASEQDKATKAAEAEIAKLAILAARKIVKTGEANDTGSSK